MKFKVNEDEPRKLTRPHEFLDGLQALGSVVSSQVFRPL